MAKFWVSPLILYFLLFPTLNVISSVFLFSSSTEAQPNTLRVTLNFTNIHFSLLQTNLHTLPKHLKSGLCLSLFLFPFY